MVTSVRKRTVDWSWNTSKLSGSRTGADRQYLIDSGRIVLSGDWDAFGANPDPKTRYLTV